MYKTVLLILFFNIFCDIAYGVTYYPCSNKTSQKGEAIQIVKANLDEKTKETNFAFNSTGLESILLRQEIRNKELIVLSITGDYRKGKSFLLTLLLQYLEGSGKGLENSKIKLEHGFHWRGGSERDTGGMLMWSEPFCVKTESGKELAILLMDTQGANDGELSAGETATVFGLSFLTSSVMLYNQQTHIQDNDLQILKVFTQYGGIITGNHETNHKPFQKLLFLIRDWMNPNDYNYGEKGGNKYIENIMEKQEKLSEDSKKFRRQLSLSFTNISGFLMPHPGLKVAQGVFKPEEIEKIFIDSVNELAAVLFKPENTVIKQVAGKNINGEQLFEYFKTSMNTFKKSKIKMTDFIEAKCESDNLIAFGNAKIFYTTQMSTNCSDEFESMEPNKLRNNHVIIRNQTIEQFNQSTNSSANICEDALNKYLTDLVKWLEEQFGVCSSKNQMKRLENFIKQLQNSNKEIEQLKDYSEKVTKKLEDHQNLIKDQQSTIKSQQEKIYDSKKEIDRLRNTTDGFNEKMTQVKLNEANINNSNKQMEQLKSTIKEEMKRLSDTNNEKLNNLIPIGFIYTQLPGQSEPKNIWLNMVWSDVTPDYAGLFFRAQGGKSLSFGQVQNEDSPRLIAAKHVYDIRGDDLLDIKPGVWSRPIYLSQTGTDDQRSMSFLVSNAEVVPRNMAMRLWKRIK